MSTIQELLEYGKEQLEKSGNEYAKYERKVLLEEVLGCNYMYMLMNGEEPVKDEAAMTYKTLIEKRCGHYPLQYLLGKAHFMDYTFFVNEDVLIPRNDTEILVEKADELLEELIAEGNRANTGLLDMCCGSGCIGISLKLYHRKIKLYLSDFSGKALEVAEKNLDKYNLTAKICCGDLFEPVGDEKFMMIVCNPPYIESKVIDTLMPEVKDYEPMLALDGGEDGLDFYRRIVKDAGRYLDTGGYLMFEIGHNQGVRVVSLMEEEGYKDIKLEKDYAGLDRVVYGHL